MKNPECQIVEKVWGYEKIFHNDDKYCGKLLHFNKNHACSWHVHVLKDEHFYLASGKLLLKYSFEDDISKAEEVVLDVGDHFHVPVGLKHRMIALEDSDLIEMSSTFYESDSIRLLNGY